MSFFSGRRQQESEDSPAAPQAKASLPPAPRQPIGFETVLGASAILNGDLRSQGNIRLDGIFEGSLEIDGNVLVGETAKITADVNARNISIAGAVRGNVNGNKVQILRTGRVWGDINAAAITTEEGAFIDGKITMISHEAALQGFEAPSLPEPANGEPEFLGELDDADEDVAEGEVYEAEMADAQDAPDEAADEGEPYHFHSELDDLPVDEDGVVG
jgi:cytoskeletal protein CcmA (bactofilin family)